MRIKFDRSNLKVQFRNNIINNDLIVDVNISESKPYKFLCQSVLDTSISLSDLNLTSEENESLITILDKIFEKVIK